MDEVIVHLTIDGELIETTFEHPFYTTDGRWVHAGGLAVGTHIRRLDGDTGAVEAVVTVSDPQPMFNLTVAEARTFFVGDGAWLVHNCGGSDIPDDLEQMDFSVYYGDWGKLFYEPPKQLPLPGFANVTYGSLDSLGRPTGVHARIKAPISTGSPAGTTQVTGWPGFNSGYDRTHLLADMLGGSGTITENLVPMMRKVNQVHIKQYEYMVRRAVNAGQEVDYWVSPIYKGNKLIPDGLEIRARGSGENPLNFWVTILNR